MGGQEMQSAARSGIAARLSRRLGPEHCVSDAEGRSVYESDALTAYRQLPWLVALPGTIDELRYVVAECAAAGIPLVPRGAGTGLSGGALPVQDAVLLSLARFNRILEIDVDNRIARVEPGVTNLAISDAVAPAGLYYAPDPSSQVACTIGGNVAENSGGVHCLKYGLTLHNVLGLKVVTADGELLELGGRTLDSPGYDLLALMHGSEGMLGIVVEVTVKLLPSPPQRRVVVAAFDEVGAAAAAVSAIIASGVVPAGLEMMDRLAIEAAEAYTKAGYPTDCEAMLLCELDGIEADVAEQTAAVERVLQAHAARAVRSSRDEAERLALWRGRKAAFPALGRIAPDYYCMDGTIPRRHLGRVLESIAALARQFGLPVANVFHAGDGNLHPLVLYDANAPGELERAEQLGGRILELCVEVGGTVTGEHGVGVEKLDQMCVQFSSQELEMFHAVKAAFDPRGLLNPGKAVPTLHRCAEFGRTHVHGGRLPHPELERY
jgi:glycolate oxidase